MCQDAALEIAMEKIDILIDLNGGTLNSGRPFTVLHGGVHEEWCGAGARIFMYVLRVC